jgi:hypothetical protein
VQVSIAAGISCGFLGLFDATLLVKKKARTNPGFGNELAV